MQDKRFLKAQKEYDRTKGQGAKKFFYFIVIVVAIVVIAKYNIPDNQTKQTTKNSC